MMENKVNGNSIQRTARTAGLLYLILAICGGFAQFASRQSLIAPGDAAATVSNIMASIGIFRLGVFSELVGQVAFILLVLYLYQLLRPVNQFQSGLMVVFVIVAVAITCLNMVNQFTALLLLGGADYLSVLGTSQLQTQVLYSLSLHKAGYMIAQVFFGLWLLPLGYLVYKSGFIPKIIGILLMVACFGYLVDVVTFFLVPGFTVTVSELTFIGELLLLFWLLIKSVNVEKWEKRSMESSFA